MMIMVISGHGAGGRQGDWYDVMAKRVGSNKGAKWMKRVLVHKDRASCVIVPEERSSYTQI